MLSLTRLIATALCVSLCIAAPPRKKIGLVLEGGGALGFAHIGVLEWLEANHIPVDYVTGTSMGGLVGGLYASGKSPAEIRSLVEGIDWNTVLRGQTPFDLLSYRRKEDRLAFPNRLEFGLRNGLSLPSGLNSGYEVDAIIDRALLPYYALKSFDDLPIPFRCVATDMVAGKQKVFDRGSLAQALRATMSIPAVFSPAMDGKQIYTDGGALNNLPVDVAKTLGADLTIAVYLDTGPTDLNSMTTLLGSAARTISIMISANEMRSIQLADVLVSADLKGFDSMDFKKSAEIIPKGIEAAQRKQTMLSLLRISDDEWTAHLSARASRRRTAIPVPQFVETSGTGAAGDREINAIVRPELNRELDSDRLDQRLKLLNGQGVFSTLSYSLTERDGKTGLLIRATEKPHGPPFLNLGINIDGSDPNDVRFGLQGRLTMMNVFGYGSEWRTDASFGATYGVTSELYRPLKEGSAWFVAPRAYINSGRFDVYNDRTRTAQYAIGRAGGGFDVGYRLGRFAEIRAGEDAAVIHGTLKIGQRIAPDGNYTLSDSSVRFQYLGQDDEILPHRGLLQQSRYDWLSGAAARGSYSSVRQQTTYFQPVSERGSLLFGASGGTSFGAHQLGLESFSLGGPFRMGAYGVNELLGNQYFLLQGGYSQRLMDLSPLIGGAVYAVGLYEVGKVWGNPIAPKLPTDSSLAIVAKTALGPVFIGGSANGSRARWWFGVGRIF